MKKEISNVVQLLVSNDKTNEDLAIDLIATQGLPYTKVLNHLYEELEMPSLIIKDIPLSEEALISSELTSKHYWRRRVSICGFHFLWGVNIMERNKKTVSSSRLPITFFYVFEVGVDDEPYSREISMEQMDSLFSYNVELLQDFFDERRVAWNSSLNHFIKNSFRTVFKERIERSKKILNGITY